MSEPQLSIVVVVLAGRVSLARCLDGVAALRGVGAVEVIVAYDDHHPDVDSLIPRYPDAVFAHLPGRRTYGEIRSLGMRHAHAAIVALTEDHCVPDAGWGEAILAAHRAPHAAIGGPVDKRGPDSATSWAVYLLDYARYASPLPEGPARELTDCNVSYKRDALVATATLWATEFHEPEIHGALTAQGSTLWQSPAIAVQQQRTLALAAALRERFDFGRLLGSLRSADAPLLRRTLLAAMGLGVPLLLVGRLLVHVRRARALRAPFLHALPWVVLLAAAWGAGEVVGYVTGQPPHSLRARPVPLVGPSP
jgi:hypothetical protein